MRSFKKIIKIIFGQATPFQLFMGLLFGFILGFIPGFSYSPLLSILFIFLVLTFNVNIGFVVITFLVSKALSFILEPLSFYVGVWLLDGFLQPLFKYMINTPVLAYAGFEYYLVTGGLAVSIVLGIIVGFMIVKLFKTVRDKMASLQKTDTYQKVVNKFWIKLTTWILLGKAAHKVDWIALQKKRLRHPFRISGMIFVITLLVLMFLFQQLLQEKMISSLLKEQLTKLNGATVDFKTLSLDMTDAKLSVTELGFANPNQLEKDRFYAAELTANLNIKHLLTKRMSLEEVVINDVSLDHDRKNKGKLYAKPIESVEKEQTTDQKIKDDQDKGMQSYQIAKYVKDAKKYKSYLDSINRFLNMISSGDQKDKDVVADTTEQQVKVYGYAGAKAKHLIDQMPTFTIQKLTAENIKTNFDGKSMDLDASNLATEPYLLKKPTVINLLSKDQTIVMELVNSNEVGKENMLSVSLNRLPAQALLENIKFGEKFNLKAKEYTLSTKGTWQIKNAAVMINLPVNLELLHADVTMNNTEKHFDSLPLKFNINGSLNNPSLSIDQSQIKNLLLQAGVSEIKDRLNDQMKGNMPSLGF